MNTLARFFQDQFEHPNYLYFLLSLVLMLIIPSLASVMPFGDLLLKFCYGLVIIMACVYTSKNYADVKLLGSLGAITFIIFCVFPADHILSLLNPLFTLSFFGLVLSRLMDFVFRPKAVRFNDVLALCAGYLIIGVIGASFLFMLNYHIGNAFSIPQGSEFYDLLYFSYVTLTGVGYGDIVPSHSITKAASLLIGIVGQLYLVIVVGIIIGKYLANDRKRE